MYHLSSTRDFAWPAGITDQMRYQQFLNPPLECRAISFWALNGNLQARELARQLDYFKSMGLAGACLHARSGLQTPYLSRHWFALVRSCIEHARRRGMIIWLYDEDRYPSGSAGGMVTQRKEFRQKRLRLENGSSAERGDDAAVLAWFAISGKPDRLESYRRIQDPAQCGKGEKAVLFRVCDSPFNPWFNGYTYLDTMSPSAVKAFIESTYEPYRRAFHQEFGKTVEGIFTDEPGYGPTLGKWWGDFIDGYKEAEQREIPWTASLPKRFRERYGYDLLSRLPEVYWDFRGVSASSARYQYHSLIASLLRNSFCRTIGQWCERAGIKFLGHVLSEETPSSQTNVVGSAMPMYEHFDIPGVDVLTAHCRDYDTVIQCASVANQMRRKWVLSETLGATGWNFTLEGHKSLTDWQMALGVNRRCLHLSFYTMAGAAKRDYPASISFQSAWSPHYKQVEDYCARITAVLSKGKPVRPVLVIHPIESTWLRYRAGWSEASDVIRLDQNIANLRDWLLAQGIGFDYADEDQLGRWGHVIKEGDQAKLAVRFARYGVVVVPPVLTIRSTTLQKLKRFRASGGQVIWLGRVPEFVDATESVEALDFAECCQRVAFRKRNVAKALGPAGEIRLYLVNGAPTVLHHLRRQNNRAFLFICNTNEMKPTKVFNIEVAARGHVEDWDPASGKRFTVPAVQNGRFLRFKTDLPPAGSRMFIINQRPARELQRRPQWREVRRQTLGDSDWDYRLSEGNPLVLDFVRVRIGNGRWTEPMEVLRADRWVRQKLGWKPHSYFEVQPWKQSSMREKRYRVEVKSSFCIEGSPPKSLILAAELIRGQRSLAFNGRALNPASTTKGWVDSCFRQFKIDAGLFRKGRNEVLLTLDYETRSGLEAAYVLSDGGVTIGRREATLCDRPRTLKIGDVTRQGLPFYGASISYVRDVHLTPRPGERVFVSLPRWAGSCAIIHLDGKEAGKILWQPYEVELPVTAAGSHELAVEIILGRGNTFGPLHVRDMPVWHGPFEWETAGARWQDTYNLAPSGLLSAPEISYRKPK